MLIHHAAQQVLAEVRHFGVLIHDQDAARLADALANRRPIVGEDAAQVDHVEREPLRLSQLIRRLDAQRLDLILAEPVPETGLGQAIMDRLRRAAAHFETSEAT